MSDVLIEVKNLVKRFPIHGGILGREVDSVKAVSDVSFSIKRGTTLGLVGESGCGKTTLGRCILRLSEPTSGSVIFDGKDLIKLSRKEMRKIRGKMQIIFQDPFASLNPRMTVGSILSEPIYINKIASHSADINKRVLKLLNMCGLRSGTINRYPHEFSGGQRQRICIARALAVDPDFIVCDEPVSALDVSIQAQIVNLLQDLQGELGLTYLFIAHDLQVIEHISDEVAVMYLGKIVEQASSRDLYTSPMHPYTEALFSAIPIPDPRHKKERIILEGDVPSPLKAPSGCHFHPRCSRMLDVCSKEVPAWEESRPRRHVACFNPCGKENKSYEKKS